MEADSLLDLLREELRKRLADSMGADWQAKVKELGARADREYSVVLAFGRCLDSAFEAVKRFPWQADKWVAGKIPPVPLARSAEPHEPVMSQAEHDAILEEKAAKGNRFVLDILKTRKPAAQEAAGVLT